MTGQAQVTQLADRIERDIEFASALELDTLTTLSGAGFDELGSATADERDHVADLVDRIYRDEGFRKSVERDPRTVLDDWGIPEAAIESVLIVAGAPEEVIERASADVEAHLSLRKPLTLGAMAAVLGALAFAQEANAGSSPTTSSSSGTSASAVAADISVAAVPAQVPAAVAPGVVSAALANARTSHSALNWQGVSATRLSAQHLASLLRIQ
jgi:hypothetical protein